MKRIIRLAVPNNDIVAFCSRMMNGGEFYADGDFLLYSKKKNIGGVTAEFRVDVEGRRFFPQVRIECDGRVEAKPILCGTPLYGFYDFGDVVVSLASYEFPDGQVA